uniref:KIB1-4 beta-propeller domain-containing protein n=1 Tax=Aegilops tauschii subsp. strangulata TaxID=200361 RepID=A0A453J732_AEGTS
DGEKGASFRSGRTEAQGSIAPLSLPLQTPVYPHSGAGLGHHELIPVTSLGDRALFVSLDRCLSVSANNLPSISSNSIYLTVSLPDPVVVHCLSSRSFERPTALCQVHDGKKMICPSVRPFTLADHLLTYCNRHEWSNG